MVKSCEAFRALKKVALPPSDTCQQSHPSQMAEWPCFPMFCFQKNLKFWVTVLYGFKNTLASVVSELLLVLS